LGSASFQFGCGRTIPVTTLLIRLPADGGTHCLAGQIPDLLEAGLGECAQARCAMRLTCGLLGHAGKTEGRRIDPGGFRCVSKAGVAVRRWHPGCWV